MSSLLIKEWEDSQTQGGTTMGSTNKNNIPFDPSKVDLLSDASELVQLTGPKIVFCTGLDFKIGDMSTEALQYLCNDQRTTIILTEKSKFHNNLSDELYQDWYNLAKLRSGLAEDGIAVPLERTLKLNNYFREEPLAGQELKDFKDKVNTKRKENLLAKVRSKRNKNLLNADNFGDSSDDDDEEDDEEDDEDEEQDGEGDRKGRGIKVEIDEKKLESVAAAAAAAAATSTTVTGNTNEIDASADAVDSLLSDKIKETLATNKPLDIRITHKLRPRQAMFPFFPTTHKQKFDDYGEVIDIKMYQKNEEPTQKKLVIDRKRHYNNNHNEGEKKDAVPKITPQESLNNEVLQKYLDTLFAPKKRVVPYNSTKELRVRCGLSFVDLSGLVDLRSLSLIVSLIKPYNLLLLPDETSAEDSETNQLSTVKKMFVQQQSNKQEQQFKKNVVNSARYMSLTNIRSGLYGGVSSSNSNKMNIEVPEPNKTIRIGYDDDSVGGIGLTNFEIKLDDAIFENLTWQNIDGSYKVAQVYGALEIANPKHEGETEEGEGDKKRLKTLNDYMNSSTQFTLKHLLKKDFLQQQQNFFQSITDNSSDNNGTKQLTEANNTAVNPKLAIGNVRLTELKKKLLAKNLNVEFKSEGTLVVNDMLAIRKVTYGSGEGDDDTGDIIIDGLMGPLYYEVKDCIREMLAYV